MSGLTLYDTIRVACAKAKADETIDAVTELIGTRCSARAIRDRLIAEQAYGMADEPEVWRAFDGRPRPVEIETAARRYEAATLAALRRSSTCLDRMDIDGHVKAIEVYGSWHSVATRAIERWQAGTMTAARAVEVLEVAAADLMEVSS